MPLFRARESTHHHGLLAGVSAGGMAVLAAFGLVLVSWHRVAGTVSDAVTVIVWAATVAVVGLVAAAAVYVALRLRHHARYPETLTARPAAGRTEAPASIPVGVPAAIPAPHPVAELPAGAPHTHYHFSTAEAVEAMRRGYAPTVVITDAQEITR